MSEPVRLCQHTIGGGVRCQAPATRLSMYCRHHMRYYNVAPMPDYVSDALRSPEGITTAILQAIHEARHGHLDQRTFGQMMNLFAHSIRQFRTR